MAGRPRAPADGGAALIVRRLAAVGLVVLFVLGAGLAVRQTWDVLAPVDAPTDKERTGLQDFRDTVHHPVRALWQDGVNPYDHDASLRDHPGQQPFNLYLPAWLLLTAPFGLLSYDIGKVAWVGVILLGCVALARAVLVLAAGERRWLPAFGLAGLLLLTVPGRNLMVLGQLSVVPACGVVLAATFAHRRPTVAGIGVALALLKPQFGVPLVVLLAVGWQAWRALIAGVGIALLASVVPLGLAVAHAGGPQQFVEDISDNASYSTEAYRDLLAPEENTVRVDAAFAVLLFAGRDNATAIEALAGVVVLGAAALSLRRLAPPRPRDDPLVTVVIALAVLVGIAHIDYEAVLLLWPLVALLAASRGSRGLQLGLAALIAVPLLHNFRVDNVLDAIGFSSRAMRIIDAVALSIAFVVAVATAVRSRSTQADAVPSRMTSLPAATP